MKKLMAALFILALAGVANAQYNTNFIGISSDEALTVCYGDLPLGGGALTTYYSVYLADINGCTGAEFRVDHLPSDPMLFETRTWHGLTIGDLGYGFSIALNVPGAGPIVPLGNIAYFNFNFEFGPDWLMTIMETLDSGNLMITDLDYVEIPVEGGTFTFNCGDPLFCICIDEGTATEDASWGQIKNLY